MNRPELGMFEDDPRSVAGAEALALLDAETNKSRYRAEWAAKDLFVGNDSLDDPRAVAARAAIRDERTWDAYKQREAWVLKQGVEVTPGEA
jgi:hypothetical protein